MILYTLEQRWKILRYYFEMIMVMLQNVCVNKRMDFGRRETPSAPYIRYLVKKVKETAILLDKPMREKPKKQCVHPRILLLWHRRSQLLNI